MKVRMLIQNIRIALDVLRAAARPDTIPPDDMVARLIGVGAAHADAIKAVRWGGLELGADLVEAMAEVGVSRSDALRYAANELISVAAFLVRALKSGEGSDISPARFALVSYVFARDVAQLGPFEATSAQAEVGASPQGAGA